jgi:hypothetical protein
VTGRLDTSLVPEPSHRCDPPSDGHPFFWTSQPAGARFHCACGRVWIVRWVEGRDFGTQRQVGHLEWFPESRRERRARLRSVSVYADASIQVGPHEYAPLSWITSLLSHRGRCARCYLARDEHPTTGYTQARPL